MILRPVLGEWEIPSITRIATVESRRAAWFAVPGLTGDLSQDLGIGSLAVEIEGALHGDEVRDEMLARVRERFRAGEPLGFVADIVNSTDLDRVLIEELFIQEANDGGNEVRYRIVLRQYVEPPAPPALLDDFGAELASSLNAEAALGFAGLELPDLLGELPQLADPVAPMKPALEGVRAATTELAQILGTLKAKVAG